MCWVQMGLGQCPQLKQSGVESLTAATVTALGAEAHAA